MVADDACGLQQAIEAARQLVSAGVPAVIGHLCSHSSLLAAGIYETADVLMITPSSTHPRLTEEGRQNVFRLKGRDDQQGKLAADLLAAHWPGEAIAILHDGSVYGEGLAMQARQQLRAKGVTPAIYDLYTPGEADYSALAARLQAAGIEVLFLGGYGPDAARIIRALRARGDDLQLVGGDGLGMNEFWTIAGEDGAGTLFSARPWPKGLPAAAELLERLQARVWAPRRAVSAGMRRSRSGPRRSSARVRSTSPRGRHAASRPLRDRARPGRLRPQGRPRGRELAVAAVEAWHLRAASPSGPFDNRASGPAARPGPTVTGRS